MRASTQAPEKTKGAAPDQENAPSVTNDANDSAVRAEDKAFFTVQAKLALAGHAFYRTRKLDGTILFLAGRWGCFRELKNLEAAAAMLMQIGGQS